MMACMKTETPPATLSIVEKWHVFIGSRNAGTEIYTLKEKNSYMLVTDKETYELDTHGCLDAVSFFFVIVVHYHTGLHTSKLLW